MLEKSELSLKQELIVVRSDRVEINPVELG